jgi:hypothetical protein
MANLNFDATGIEPNQPFEPLPPGSYVAQIVASEMRPTKKGDGQYLELELEVLEGPYQGWKLFDRLNLVNDNPKTVEIAQRTLSSICHATGRMQVQESVELHHIPFIADVRVVPPKNGYGPSNSCRYSAITAPAQTTPVVSNAAHAPSPTTAAPSSGRPVTTPPWHRTP